MGGKIAYSRPWLINRYESETVNEQQPAKKFADINDRSLCFSTVEQNVSSFSSHEYSATVLIITCKCQLPPTDPRDALHHTSRVVHKGKRSFLIDWRQSLIELSWHHLRRSTGRGEVFLRPEFGTDTSFGRRLNFLETLKRSVGSVERRLCGDNQIVRPTFSRFDRKKSYSSDFCQTERHTDTQTKCRSCSTATA